jgi:hypothetical protein
MIISGDSQIAATTGENMPQVVYTMHFKGQAAPEETSPPTMKVSAKAASCSITTVINSGGVTGGFDPAAVCDAVFESVVTLVTGSTFTETGTISFGNSARQHKLRFVSVGEGWLGQSPDPGLRQGTVTWTVEGGEGQMEGAAGTITSNFTVSEGGEVNDYQIGVIYLK